MNAALNAAITLDNAKIQSLIALRTGAKHFATACNVSIIRDADYREIDSAIAHMHFIKDLRAQVAADDADQIELDDAIADMTNFEITEIH